jgi:serine O-acetyltransferase
LFKANHNGRARCIGAITVAEVDGQQLAALSKRDGASEIRLSQWNLDAVVSELRLSREVTHRIRQSGPIRRTPSRDALIRIMSHLSAALFPTHHGQLELVAESIDYFVGNELNGALVLLVEQIRRSLSFTGGDEWNDSDLLREARSIASDFAADLPSIRGLLVSDLRAAFEGDPSATNYPEILIGYPGMTAITYHRLAHPLHKLGATFLARVISNIAHSKTGIDIHPAAEIGPSFFIDHGTGVVIGETAIIGSRVRLYQAVTLGAKRFPTDDSGALVKGAPRHPVVEDDVVIYAGATVLGRITIGRGSTIGGNVWLTQSVPAGSHVSQAHARSNGQGD